jgi:hypothetical protein
MRCDPTKNVGIFSAPQDAGNIGGIVVHDKEASASRGNAFTALRPWKKVLKYLGIQLIAVASQSLPVKRF